VVVAVGETHRFEIKNTTLHLEDEVRMFFRNVGAYLPNNVVSYKVNLSLYLTNFALLRDVWGSGCIDPRILDLGTSWR
jgi:hypothetical protein